MSEKEAKKRFMERDCSITKDDGDNTDHDDDEFALIQAKANALLCASELVELELRNVKTFVDGIKLDFEIDDDHVIDLKDVEERQQQIEANLIQSKETNSNEKYTFDATAEAV